MSGDIRAKHQRAGYLYKIPMSKPDSERWQKRLFVAKDGFLLFYSPNKSPDSQHFDTKVKGVIPLGGCTTEKCERGPKGCKFGLKVSHPDFYVGRQLVLACESADEQKAWLETLNDCGRVTMENALLGDSMIEKLQAEGTAAEEEKNKALEELQQNALKLKNEQDEKKRLAEEAKQTEEMKEKVKELENQMQQEREDLEKKLKEQQQETEKQLEAKRQAAKDAEEAAKKAQLEQQESNTDMTEEEREELKRKAEKLQQEKERLAEERSALEEEVTTMNQNQEELRSSLEAMSIEKDNMEKKLKEVQENSDRLQREQRQRKRLERKLQVAEDSLKRLDEALRRSGVKLDIDVFADVSTLKSFFEERVDEVRRDAQKIDIMKQALQAKKRYLMAGENANSNGAAAAGADDGSDDEEEENNSETEEETW